MVVGALVAAAIWMPVQANHAVLIASILFVVAVGFFDDRLELRASWKLIGQVGAAIVFVWSYGCFGQLPFMGLEAPPYWLAALITLVFLVGVTNAVNLSDGLDGLAAGNVLLSLLLLAYLSVEAAEPQYGVLALATAGGLLGFLRFNSHPARIFMGDVGSQFLGFTAAAITVLLLQDDKLAVSPALPLLIFGLPILDVIAVTMVRLWSGRPVFRADRSHLHHQLLKLGLRHYEVVIVLYSLQAIAVGMAYTLRFESDTTILLAYGAYCAVILTAVYWMVSNRYAFRSDVSSRGERRNPLFRKLVWLHHHAAIVVSVVVAGVLLSSAALLDVNNDLYHTVCLSGFLLLPIAWVFFRGHPRFVVRLTYFTAATLIVYGLILDQSPLFTRFSDFALLLLAIVLAFAIRITRRDLFRLDSQDYLVLLIFVLVPLVPLPGVEQAQLARVTLHFAVLLYACEFVLACKGRFEWVLSVSGIAGLAVLTL